MLREVIRFFRSVYWPMVKAYFFIFKPETRGVKIILTNKDEILFLKHTYGIKYNLPGGNLGKNENPKEGALREIREELGVEAKNLHFLSTIVPPLEFEYRKNTIHIFTAELSNKNVFPNNFEVAEIIWRNYSDLPSLGHTAYSIIKTFLTNNHGSK